MHIPTNQSKTELCHFSCSLAPDALWAMTSEPSRYNADFASPNGLSVLAIDLDVVILKTSAASGNMYCGGRGEEFGWMDCGGLDSQGFSRM